MATGGQALPGQRTTDFVAPPGGVMTDEVGVITGELTLRTEVDGDGTVTHLVQYKDAAEWYGVTDLRITIASTDIDKLHAAALGKLTMPRPG